MDIIWAGHDYEIHVAYEDGGVHIAANKTGLLSLANILIALANDNGRGSHIHLDEYNSLENGSIELLIEKI